MFGAGVEVPVGVRIVVASVQVDEGRRAPVAVATEGAGELVGLTA